MVCPVCITAAVVANAPALAAAAAAAAAGKVAVDAAAAARQAPLRVQAKPPQAAKLPRPALQALKAAAPRPLSGSSKPE